MSKLILRIGLVLMVLGLLLTSCLSPLISELAPQKEVGRDGFVLVNMNPDPNGEPWLVSGMPPVNEGARGLGDSATYYVPQVTLGSLPSSVDNSLRMFFPPIFNQNDGSCSQASGVAYTFTYEINRLRNLSGSLPSNQYPTHFTYNFLNGGHPANGTWYWDGWKIIEEMGVPDVTTYGGQLWAPPTQWMSGYDAYQKAMKNRISGFQRIAVGTPQGLDTLKQWLAHHGEGSSSGGLVVFAAGAVGTGETLAEGTPQAGKYVVSRWGTVMNHAMTFVGYDDEVRYDYNGDGVYTNHLDTNGDGVVTMLDWEIGALIVVNSWGASWGNNGRAYMPYRLLAEYQQGSGNGGVYNNEVFLIHAVADYEPKASVKVKVSHSGRAYVSFSLGMTQDLQSNTDQVSRSLHAFQLYGAGLYPLQGINSNPLELALDVSDFAETAGSGQAYKVAFKAYEGDYNGSYTGTIHSMSLVDHEQDLEILSPETNIPLVDYETKQISVVFNPNGGGYTGQFPTLFLRGTPNGWTTTPMALVGNNLWGASLTFSGGASDRFKFDVLGDWSQNYGDNQGDGYGDLGGNDIFVTQAGTYQITFHDVTKAYTITLEGANPVFQKGYDQVYLRGTFNQWGTLSMTLAGNYLWEAPVTFAQGSTGLFKVDVYGDWTLNFGDNNQDGYGDQNGNDIGVSGGSYLIRFNDQTKQYQVIPQ